MQRAERRQVAAGLSRRRGRSVSGRRQWEVRRIGGLYQPETSLSQHWRKLPELLPERSQALTAAPSRQRSHSGSIEVALGSAQTSPIFEWVAMDRKSRETLQERRRRSFPRAVPSTMRWSARSGYRRPTDPTRIGSSTTSN